MGLSQLLSGLITIIGLVVAIIQFQPQTLSEYVLIHAALLALIWCPETINEYTPGLRIDGYKIDNPTPLFLISGFGWVLILLINGALFGII